MASSTTHMEQEELQPVLGKVLLSSNDDGDEGVVDEDMVSYLSGLLAEGLSLGELVQEERVKEQLEPFLESMGCSSDKIEASCSAVMKAAENSLAKTTTSSSSSTNKLKQGVVNMKKAQSMTEADEDAARYMWGQKSLSVSFNEQKEGYTDKVSAKDKRKARQELERARREYEAKLRETEAEEAKQGAVSAMVLPDYNSGRREKDIQVRNVSLSLDNGRLLLDSAEIKFAYHRRYGLVGKNGVGKTTLLKAIASLQIEGFPRHHRILHVRQELGSSGDDVSVLQTVINADVERNSLLKESQELLAKLEQDHGNESSDAAAATMTVEEKRLKMRQDQKEGVEFNDDLKRLDEVYARLQILGSDAAESRAAMILSGLQFTTAMQQGPTSALSGGWRMRVALAAALFIEPDLLLLDEPTNHLDLEAVLWLESYLVEYKHTLVVVSHDRGFLNEVCTDIIEFQNLKLTYYRGNYDTYVKTSEESVRNAMRVYQAYQEKRDHMMEFITKFRANAKRSTLVQSRIKAVEKMDAEAPEPVEIEPVWRFSIHNPEPLGRPIISVDDVTFDYSPKEKKVQEYLLQTVNFGVDLDSRIGILGANGAGKSTLLNLIMDKLQPTKGSVSRNGRLRIGHFTQHSADKFDLTLSATENMLTIFGDAQDQEMRSFLGRFQIQGADALKPMLLLSGGQKSRVAFATLAYQKPHVIIMDEPTNHLDMESIDALVEAVKDFRGGLIVVSHDQYFITNTCGELWVVGDGHATRFRGDFNEYKKETLARTAKRVADSVKSLGTMNN